jgi:hypothetical protein
MAVPLAPAIAICSICGEPLNANGNCLACLLRGGLDESVAETEPAASLVFGDFEVTQRADGFYWELGHGAMGVTYLAMDKVLRRRVALKVIEVPEAARGSQAVRDRFCVKLAPRLLCDIRMWLPYSSSAFRRIPVAAITPWNWSKAKPWKLACGKMVRLSQSSRLESRSKSRAH